MAASRSRRFLGVSVLAAFAVLAAVPPAGAWDWSQYGATVTHAFDGGANPPAALGLVWSQATNVAANATAAITGNLTAPGGEGQFAFHADLDGQTPANLWLRKMAVDNGSMDPNVGGWEFRVPASALSALVSPGLAGPPRTLALSGTRLYGVVTAANATHAQDVLFRLDVSSGNATVVLQSLAVFRTAPWPALAQRPARSAPAVGEGYLVFGSNDGSVYALWEGNFSLAWQYATGTPVVTVPTVYGNFVYVTAGTSLYFLDLFGSLVFTIPAGATVAASPVLTATSVFLDAGGVLSAYNRSTAVAGWSQPTGSASVGTPALAGSSVIARRADGRVFAFDQASGRIAWVRPGAPAPADGEDLALAGTRAFLSAGSDLVAFDTTSGALAYDNASSPRPPLGSPIAAGTVVLVTEGSRLLAYRGQPDLLVRASEIAFNAKGIVGQSVTGNFSVTVRNAGDEPAGGLVVRVYDGTPASFTWTTNLTITRPIKDGGQATVETQDRAWSVGRHVITVRVEPAPTETETGNNEVTTTADLVAGPPPPPQVVGSGPYWVALLLGFGAGALVLYLPLRRLREVRHREAEPEPPAPEKV